VTPLKVLLLTVLVGAAMGLGAWFFGRVSVGRGEGDADGVREPVTAPDPALPPTVAAVPEIALPAPVVVAEPVPVVAPGRPDVTGTQRTRMRNAGGPARLPHAVTSRVGITTARSG